MLLPQTAEYALRAVLHIAVHQGDGAVRTNEAAEAVGVPANYLAKTLNLLAKAGILRSTRGPAGGFRLVVPAESLTLGEVVSPFRPSGPRRCLMGLGTCGQTPGCPVHEHWHPVAERFEAFFGEITIAELVGRDGCARAAPAIAQHLPDASPAA